MLTPNPQSYGEFELKEGSAWVTVGNISVFIRKNESGVAVDLFPLGDEMAESLAGTWLTYAEAEPEENL